MSKTVFSLTEANLKLNPSLLSPTYLPHCFCAPGSANLLPRRRQLLSSSPFSPPSYASSRSSHPQTPCVLVDLDLLGLHFFLPLFKVCVYLLINLRLTSSIITSYVNSFAGIQPWCHIIFHRTEFTYEFIIWIHVLFYNMYPIVWIHWWIQSYEFWNTISQYSHNHDFIKVAVRHSFNTTTVLEQHPRSHYKGALNRVLTGDQLHPVLCHCQLGYICIHIMNSYKISWSWIHVLHFMNYEFRYEFM